MYWCVRYGPIKSHQGYISGRNLQHEQNFLSLSRHERPKQSFTSWTLLPPVSKNEEGPQSPLNIENLPQDRGFLFSSCGNSCISCFQISLDEISWFNHGMFLWAKIINIREESKLGIQVQSHHTRSHTHAQEHTHLHWYNCLYINLASKTGEGH